MKKTKPYNDQGLRLALQHRNEAAEKMKPSADFADRLMQRIEEQTAKPKHRRVWLYSGIAAAAASVLLLLTLHYNKVEPKQENIVAEQTERPTTTTKTEETPTTTVTKEEKTMVAEAKTTVAKEKTKVKQTKTMVTEEKTTVKQEKPILAQATQHQQPQMQPQIQPQPIAEKKKTDEKVKKAEIDLKKQLHYAELEMEKATHRRQAAYEKEMKQRCLQLVLTILTPQEEEKEATAGKVRTQQS